MADPQAALATQLRNIERRTGTTLAAMAQALAGSGAVKHAGQRHWLMQHYGLGYGDANTVVHLAKQGGLPVGPADGGAPAAVPPPPADATDPLDAIYTGGKAHLRPVHEAFLHAIADLPEVEQAPKKAYVSLRRKTQFAMLGPATQSQLELGLNLKAVEGLPPLPGLKAQPPGGMCQYTLRFGSADAIDATLLAWVRAAHAAAG